MRKLSQFVALALAMAVVLQANGEVVSFTLTPPLDIMESGFVRLDTIDLNEDTIADFTFASDSTGVFLRTERDNRFAYRASPPPNIGGPVAALRSGFAIGTNLSDLSVAWASSDFLGGYVDPGEASFAVIVLCLSTGCATDFRNQRDFIGLEFRLPDGIHYGYLDVFAGDYAGISLHGWAYETTPGMSITAVSVPEPGSVWLLGAAGVAGVLVACRRRAKSLHTNGRRFVCEK